MEQTQIIASCIGIGYENAQIAAGLQIAAQIINSQICGVRVKGIDYEALKRVKGILDGEIAKICCFDVTKSTIERFTDM